MSVLIQDFNLNVSRLDTGLKNFYSRRINRRISSSSTQRIGEEGWSATGQEDGTKTRCSGLCSSDHPGLSVSVLDSQSNATKEFTKVNWTRAAFRANGEHISTLTACNRSDLTEKLVRIVVGLVD